MDDQTKDDAIFAKIFVASIVIAVITVVAADTGSFWKDLACGIGLGFLCLVSISSAFMK